MPVAGSEACPGHAFTQAAFLQEIALQTAELLVEQAGGYPDENTLHARRRWRGCWTKEPLTKRCESGSCETAPARGVSATSRSCSGPPRLPSGCPMGLGNKTGHLRGRGAEMPSLSCSPQANGRRLGSMVHESLASRTGNRDPRPAYSDKFRHENVGTMRFRANRSIWEERRFPQCLRGYSALFGHSSETAPWVS